MRHPTNSTQRLGAGSSPGLIFFLSHGVDKMTLDLSGANKAELATQPQGKI